MTPLSRHQSLVWVHYVGGGNHAAQLVSSSAALAFVTKMSDKHVVTSPSVIQVKNRRNKSVLTLRRLMSYIYIYIYMEHPFLMFLDHTQRRSTVGRTPLDE